MSVEEKEEKFASEVAAAIDLVHELLQEAPSLPAINSLMVKLECVLSLQEDAVLRLRRKVLSKDAEDLPGALGTHSKSTR